MNWLRELDMFDMLSMRSLELSSGPTRLIMDMNLGLGSIENPEL